MSANTQEFDEHFMMLLNAIMHLIDNENVDVDAIKELRGAQLCMMVGQVEEGLDPKTMDFPAYSYNNMYTSSAFATGGYINYPLTYSNTAAPITNISPVISTVGGTWQNPVTFGGYTSKLRIPRRYR